MTIKRYTAYAAQWTLNVLAWCEISFFLHNKLKICMVSVTYALQNIKLGNVVE